MGKRRRGNERRMCAKPNHRGRGGGALPTGTPSPQGGGGGGAGGAGVPPAVTPTVVSSPAPAPPGAPTTGSTPPVAPHGGPIPTTGTPVQSPGSSGSSGSAGARGGVPSPTTPSGSSSSSGGIPVQQPPSFLTRRANLPQIQSQYDRRYSEAERLLTYLETNCTEEADALWSNNKWHLKPCFDVFRKNDRPLSHAICNNIASGQPFYTAAVRNFLLNRFKTKPLEGRFKSVDELMLHIEEHANLSFPKIPKSLSTFKDIPMKSIVVQIFAGEKNKAEAVEPAPVVRVLFAKMLEHMLDNHILGLCWGGQWSLDDWEIINGTNVVLSAPTIPRIGRENSDKDLVQIAAIVLPSFRIRGVLPCFMQHLQDELNNLPLKPGDALIQGRSILAENDFFGWFYYYLKYHPAVFSPVARSNLLQGFYFLMDKLDYRKRSYYHDIFNKQWFEDWRMYFHPPMATVAVRYDVFWYKKVPHRDPNLMPHENTIGGMLGYHRHLVQHSPDHGRTKRLKGLGTLFQSMTNSDEAELIAALHSGKLLPEFIKLVLQKSMLKAEFLKHWKMYVATRFVA